MDALAYINAETIEKQQKRIEALEQLCRDQFDQLSATTMGIAMTKVEYEDFADRMDALGLLEGGEK